MLKTLCFKDDLDQADIRIMAGDDEQENLLQDEMDEMERDDQMIEHHIIDRI